MRLFLSSYGLGNKPEALVELVGAKNRAAVISNAGDYHNQQELQERNDKEFEALANLGLEPEILDLKLYFKDHTGLKEHLKSFGLVWLRGGNSFILLRAILESGFDVAIKELLANDQIVYGGFSAGAVVATENLKGIDIVDDPNVVPEGYPKDIPWKGMGLVEYSIAPHYRSNHPESPAIEETVKYFKENGMPYKALSDGQVVIVDGPSSKVIE